MGGWGGGVASLIYSTTSSSTSPGSLHKHLEAFCCLNAHVCVRACVSVSVGGESGGTLLWGRGGAVPPPAFEDERNVRWRPFSFAQGGTCLARSRPTTSSLAGGRAGGREATTGRR